MHENLLQQIQSGAISSNTDLPGLLRLCRLLAQRLDSAELKQWVMHELDGYPLSADLPDYRKDSSVFIYGDFMGFNAIMNRIQIPLSAIRSPLKEKISQNQYRESIPRISNLASHAGEIATMLPPDFHCFISHNFLRDDFVVTRAWLAGSKERMINILSTVQNRILDFTLELESRAAESGDPLKQLRTMPQEVKQEFHTHIMGNVSNLSQGGNNLTQNTTNTSKGI